MLLFDICTLNGHKTFLSIYSKVYKILNGDIKRTPVRKKRFYRQKWLWNIHLKNVGFIYKSKILKFKMQQKVLYKKYAKKNNTTRKTLRLFKMQET